MTARPRLTTRFRATTSPSPMIGWRPLSVRGAYPPRQPRNAEAPPGGPAARIAADCIRFGLTGNARDDLVAPVRFHRLLRRGRPCTTWCRRRLAPHPTACGIRFLCLNANIARQFELYRTPGSPASASRWPDRGKRPAARQPRRAGFALRQLHLFARTARCGGVSVGCRKLLRVRGGAYFFLPGIRALRYLASAGN